MSAHFDRQEAKKFLFEKYEREKEQLEEQRRAILEHVISVLRDEFKDSDVEVFLVGSILIPYKFTISSDVDIVLKNFKGDRFALWPKLEEKIERAIEIILYDKCQFQEFVITNGLKVV